MNKLTFESFVEWEKEAEVIFRCDTDRDSLVVIQAEKIMLLVDELRQAKHMSKALGEVLTEEILKNCELKVRTEMLEVKR